MRYRKRKIERGGNEGGIERDRERGRERERERSRCGCVTGAFALHGVPDVAVEVVVAGEQQPAGLGEGDGGDAADDVVVRVHGELLVRADVEHAAGRVVGAGREREPGREEGDRVDVALVPREGLLALALAYVPELGGGVARARHERALVRRQRERHHVARVPGELAALLPGLDVP